MTVDLAHCAPSVVPPAQDALALRQVFTHLQADSCPRFFNFHMHTVHSDGRLRPEEVIDQAIAIGLQGFAITDHHRVSGYRAAQRYLDAWKADHPEDKTPHLWTGTEITADLLQTEVHVLGYAFNPEHPALHPYLQGKAPLGKQAQAGEVIAAIQEAGGLAVLAHPARYRRPAAELIHAAAILGCDGVETYYAYNNPNPWQPSPSTTAEVAELSDRYHLLNTCGTDTHGLSLLQRL